MVSAVLVGRVVFVGLGLVTAITVLYTCITDGSPFRYELLTPWMSATLIDFYVNIILIATWVWYKESSWTSRVIWTILLVCFGSVTACWYVAIELFKLSPEDPLHLVLLKDRSSRQAFHPSLWRKLFVFRSNWVRGQWPQGYGKRLMKYFFGGSSPSVYAHPFRVMSGVFSSQSNPLEDHQKRWASPSILDASDPVIATNGQ